jgi:hypothetical protein
MSELRLVYASKNDVVADKTAEGSSDLTKPGMGSGKLRKLAHEARLAAREFIDRGGLGDPVRDAYEVEIEGQTQEAEGDAPGGVMILIRVVDHSKAEHPRETAAKSRGFESHAAEQAELARKAAEKAAQDAEEAAAKARSEGAATS